MFTLHGIFSVALAVTRSGIFIPLTRTKEIPCCVASQLFFFGPLKAACLTAALVGSLLPLASTFAADTPAAAVTTASGLQYVDVVIGKGDVATTGHTVQVHYTGWLQNPDGSVGKKFDSSKDRGDPFAFPLGGGRVIRGWDEGVAGMRVGGMRKLTIPAALGYGARGASNVIPPNATLLFDVELLGVK